MDIFIMFIILVVVWFFGALYGWHAHIRFVDRTVDNVLHAVHKEMKANIIKIKIEKQADTFYIYDLATHTFMAQGKSVDEITDVLKEKFPGKSFAATEENLTETGFKDAKSI